MPTDEAPNADVNRSSHRRNTETARLLAFSDGVFAIAITLLILTIGVPDLKPGQTLLGELGKAWPQYLSYAISFVIIGIIWAQHHHMFSHINRVNHVFLLINIAFLMWVAFIPFPTALMAKFLANGAEQQTAMAVYSGTFVVGAVLFNLLWRYPVWHDRLVDEDTDRESLDGITRSFNIGPLFYVADFALCFVPGVGVWASLILFFVIAIFYALSPIA